MLAGGWERLSEAAWQVALLGLAFGLLGLVARRFAEPGPRGRQWPEARLNLALMVVDKLLVWPVFAVVLVAATEAVRAAGLPGDLPAFWDGVPAGLTVLAAVVVSDFVGYWRHRLMHTAWLWPSHAVHHSDAAMGWTAIFRFHPINRMVTGVLGSGALVAFGFPGYAVALNALLRFHYGAFIHMDLPWTYGRLGRVFVSPAMHRWHHTAERAHFGINFSTVFSVFDQIFGTYDVPGPCRTALGVEGLSGRPLTAQLAYPFRRRPYVDREGKEWHSLGESNPSFQVENLAS